MLKQKLEFHEISLMDQSWIKKKLAEDNLGACEYTFVNNYIWRSVYHTEVTQLYGCGIIRFREDEHHIVYSFPFGNGDKKAVIEELREECRALGRKLDLYPIVEEDRLELMEWFPGQFEIDTDRDDFDYVYTVEKLSLLKGKKLHGKRNHIARFKDDNDWSYETMSEENIEECQKMAKSWITLREEKWNEEMEQEMHVLEEAFSKFKELGLVGGVLRKAGEIVAFTMGEPLNEDSFVVHFEKAFPDLQGAYPMINQQFVQHECQNFQYVNREEDTGDLGLRKAKLSYYPDILLKKYRAVESHVVFANEMDKDAIQEIWRTCFGDDEDYIQFYLEHRFQTENMLVIHEDGRPVSMASFLPVQLMQNGERIFARYVYAVATLPEYRKKGYAAEILSYAAEKYQEPLLLQPASESLEAYYEKLGFQPYFEKKELEILPMDQVIDAQEQQKENLLAAGLDAAECDCILSGWCLKEIRSAEYKKIRDAYYEKEGYISWDKKAIEYALAENNFFGTGIARKLVPAQETEEWVSENSEEDENMREELLLFRMEGDVLHVIETTLELEELRKLSTTLLRQTKASKMVYRNEGGMIRFPKEEKIAKSSPKAYLNLTLS